MLTMVIDDDPVSRLAVSDLVSRTGLGTPTEFPSGDEAWAAFERGALPLLVCCDIRMPGMTGVDLLSRMRADPTLAVTRVVLITSSSDRETVESAIRLGAHGYILKPFAMPDALRKLDGLLATVQPRVAEDPIDTIRRLAIAPSKLTTYYIAVRRSIAQVLEETVPSEAAGLDGLRTAFLTLGLFHAAQQVERLQHRWPIADGVADARRSLDSLVARQMARAAAIGIGVATA